MFDPVPWLEANVWIAVWWTAFLFTATELTIIYIVKPLLALRRFAVALNRIQKKSGLDSEALAHAIVQLAKAQRIEMDYEARTDAPR